MAKIYFSCGFRNTNPGLKFTVRFVSILDFKPGETTDNRGCIALGYSKIVRFRHFVSFECV